jgi:hypothetical protein
MVGTTRISSSSNSSTHNHHSHSSSHSSSNNNHHNHLAGGNGGRERAIEALIDREPQGDYYRAARVVVRHQVYFIL